MRWWAAASYLVAGGTGTVAAAGLGIIFLVVFSNAERALLVCLVLIALSLTVAGVMGFFSPLKAATLAFRASLAGLAVTAMGTVLLALGRLFDEHSDRGVDLQTWLYVMVAPAILLAISLWTSRRMRSAMLPAAV